MLYVWDSLLYGKLSSKSNKVDKNCNIEKLTSSRNRLINIIIGTLVMTYV